jgi:hypothetical protein
VGLVAERLNLRLFIDGIEVPVIGARCTFAEGTVATAEIKMVATDQVYDIEPRSFVTLFVYDNFDFVDDPKTGTPNSVRIGAHDIRRWKLLFSGEMVAISMSKQGSNRTATMTCADHTNYWDFIRQHYINFRNGGVELFEAAFLGVKQDRLKFFDVLTTGTESRLYVWLTQSKNSNGEASLYLGLQRMLREMFFSVNDFYAEAFNRHRIGDQVVGLSEDETAAKLFKLQFFEKFIKSRVGGAGGLVTARQLVDSLLGPVFHTYVTVPFPRFDRKGAALGFKPDPSKKEDLDLLKGIIDRSKSWPGASLNYTVIKPDTWFLAPPICNVVFPHQYRSLSFARNYLAEPTRLFLRTSLIFTGQDKWLTERFYAPDFKVFNELLYKQGGYLQRMSETLLPHEKFVGINPAQVWQSDLAAYVQKGARRDYLARLSDYLYWKYKFGTRQVNVSGPLNLNLIPGYPGLVMDRVKSELGVTRHFLGNITSVVHSVDQMGGWTHFNMAGARVHDEKIDYDESLEGEARSLEDITSRGTDGFLDDRYDPERIGPEVYQQLFGCDSIVDILDPSERVEEVPRKVEILNPTAAEVAATVSRLNEEYQAAVEEITSIFVTTDQARQEDLNAATQSYADAVNAAKSGQTRTSTVVFDEVKLDLVPLAVEKLNKLYRSVVEDGDSVDLFTKTLTNRPKANFAELMGVDLTNVPPGRSQVGEVIATAASLELLKQQDTQLATSDGFFAAAVNPTAPTTIDNTYSQEITIGFQTKRVTETVVLRPSQVEFDTNGIKVVDVPELTEERIREIQVPRTDVKQGKYDLTSNLLQRREKVQAYVDSLLFRGLRG